MNASARFLAGFLNNFFVINLLKAWVPKFTAQKMKFFINDLFSKCDQIRTFTDEILTEKLNFLCGEFVVLLFSLFPPVCKEVSGFSKLTYQTSIRQYIPCHEIFLVNSYCSTNLFSDKSKFYKNNHTETGKKIRKN